MTTMTSLREETRTRMERFFPKALETALAHYRQVSRKIETSYPDIKKQQEACRISLVHIQLLLKLGNEIIEKSEQNDGVEHNQLLQSLIENAQAEIGEWNCTE
ncbi:MAG: hypothetical protein ACRBDL_05210 [Alphaproteobacteria bacterium]